MYIPAGLMVTGDLNIIQNQQLKDLISKGPKYREPHRPAAHGGGDHTPPTTKCHFLSVIELEIQFQTYYGFCRGICT